MKLFVLLFSSVCVLGATNPVPNSPYLPRIYKYIDALLEQPASKTNLHRHQNLLRVLYTLSDLSAKPKYREAADAALRLWLEHIPSPGETIDRPWMLWDRCFQIAPEPSRRYALAIATNQITNHPGFYLRTCAAGYLHATNAIFLAAIERFLDQREGAAADPVDCDAAARMVPEPLASRLQSVAERADDESGATPMTCVSRYENTGRIKYRDAIQAAAEEQLQSSVELPPLALGHAISLQLAAWRSNARQAHLDKARAFGDFALGKYLSEPAEPIKGVDSLVLSLVELHLHVLYITAVRYPPNTIDR